MIPIVVNKLRASQISPVKPSKRLDCS